ncbi:hypothetical protein Tco_0145652 [Tanacetum coccineum]
MNATGSQDGSELIISPAPDFPVIRIRNEKSKLEHQSAPLTSMNVTGSQDGSELIISPVPDFPVIRIINEKSKS